MEGLGVACLGTLRRTKTAERAQVLPWRFVFIPDGVCRMASAWVVMNS